MVADSGPLPVPAGRRSARRRRLRRSVRRSQILQHCGRSRPSNRGSRLPPVRRRTRPPHRNPSRGRRRVMLCRGGVRRSRLHPLRLRRAMARLGRPPRHRSRPAGLRRNPPRSAPLASPSMVQPRQPHSLRFRRERPRPPCNNSSSNGSRRHSRRSHSGRRRLQFHRPRPDRNRRNYRRSRPFSRLSLRLRHKMAARLRFQASPILLWWRRRTMARRSLIPGRFRCAVRAPRRNRRTCLCLPSCAGPPDARAIRS